jgi:hypothetical protein
MSLSTLRSAHWASDGYAAALEYLAICNEEDKAEEEWREAHDAWQRRQRRGRPAKRLSPVPSRGRPRVTTTSLSAITDSCMDIMTIESLYQKTESPFVPGLLDD